VNSKRRQIRIWELAIEYKIDPEEARKALAVGGLYRQSVDSFVPEADARRILGKPGGIRPAARDQRVIEISTPTRSARLPRCSG
jgi:hypothetical protein